LANISDGRKIGLDDGDEGRIDRLLSEATWGDAVASYRLGMLYYFGEGFPQDYEEAAKLVRYAAERGVIDAQFILSSFYADGLGLARDYIQAYKWALISASRATAGEKGEIAADLRDYLAEQMSRDEISEAEQLAQEWLAGAQ
jgi:TPR repeat protein